MKLRVRAGINNKIGDIISSLETNVNGNYNTGAYVQVYNENNNEPYYTLMYQYKKGAIGLYLLTIQLVKKYSNQCA